MTTTTPDPEKVPLLQTQVTGPGPDDEVEQRDTGGASGKEPATEDIELPDEDDHEDEDDDEDPGQSRR
jgi:hypothetical protein